MRDDDGRVARIVEYRDATPDEREIAEINVGLYVFRSDALRPALPRLDSDNAQGELYLTDVIHLLLDAEHTVTSFESVDEELCMGVNSRVELAVVNAAMRWRLLERLMLAGVTVEDPETTYVDWGVEVGRDTLLRANTHLLGRTTVGAASEVGPGSFLRDAFVGDRARVISSHLSRVRHQLRAATSAPSPTSAPTPCSPRAPRPAPSSRSRTAASASAARCRT